MATTTPPKGIAISFSKTPQAQADVFTLNDPNSGPVTLDVMANDLGGNAKSLYSLDDGVNSAGATGDLLARDAANAVNLSANGAAITITADGKVLYDATTLSAQFKSNLQRLSDGEFATDTFTYAIQLGNGTLSWTTATVQLAGANDAPIAASIAADATEDTGNPVLLTASYTDADAHDTHTAAINTASTKGTVVNNGDGTFSYDPNGQFESLALGETATDTFTYTVTDNHGASSTRTATVTVHGENDAPILQGLVGSAPVFGDDSLTISGTMAFADTDLTDTHGVTITALGTGYIGSFTPTIATDSTGGAAGSVALSYHLTLEQFMAAGGHAPDHQDYRVTIDDHHGGTSSQIVSIPLAQILSDAGGGGGGGGTTTQPPVFTNTSPPNPFISGHNLGQIVDNPFVLHPSFIPPGGFSTDLFTDGVLNFSDPDGGFHHASVDLAHAFIATHTVTDSSGVPHSAPGVPVSLMTGIWQVYVQEPGQVHWSYTLPESAIRSMTSGETETIIVPITVYEDGVGQSTQNVRIDLIGTDEPTSLLAPNTVLTASTNITPLLSPIDLATHVQTQNLSITENPLVTGSTSHHILTGTITYVDPDLFDRPTVTMTLNDPGVPLSPEVQSVRDGFSYTVEQFGNYGMIHWTFDVQDSELDFIPQDAGMSSLPYDGKLTVGATFSIGTLAGGASSTVNVTLHGANDPVIIPGSTSTSATVALHGSTSGSFTVSDADWYPDGQTIDFVPHNASTHGHIFGGTGVSTGMGGSALLSWNYTANFGAGTLVAGQHDIWDVVVTDHFGASATYTLDFLIG